MKLLLRLILFLLSTFVALSTPEISLWTNNQCSKCHINFQGGGQRNAFGKNFAKNSSVFSSFDSSILNNSIFSVLLNNLKLFSKPYNFLVSKTEQKPDSLFYYGFDFRMQSARSFKSEEAVRKFFPMQGSLYLGSTPFDFLTLEGQYNLGPIVFPGQKKWSSSVILDFGKEVPKLRLGYFQPTFGLKDCDMTSLDRRTPTPDGSEILFAPDYMEYGGELIYEPREWLSANFGVFDSKSLSEVSIANKQQLVTGKKLSYSGRIMVFPSWLYNTSDDYTESTSNTIKDYFLGASFLINGDFQYYSLFANVAIFPELHLYYKFHYSFKPETIPYERTSKTNVFGLNYIPYKGLILGFRSEVGISDWKYTSYDYNIRYISYMINAKILLFPMLELIPEYKYQITEYNKSSRYGFQLHIYY